MNLQQHIPFTYYNSSIRFREIHWNAIDIRLKRISLNENKIYKIECISFECQWTVLILPLTLRTTLQHPAINKRLNKLLAIKISSTM